MGYNTYWVGSLTIIRKLDENEAAFLEEFCKRDFHKTSLPGIPSAYCPWTLMFSGCRNRLSIIGEGKHYDWRPWLDYLIREFFVPRGKVLEGLMRWQGEEGSDRGVLKVSYTAEKGHLIQAEPDRFTNPLEEREE